MKQNLLKTSTFLVANIVYLFAMSSWVGIESFTRLIERWSHHSEMTVYLRPGTKPQDIEKLNEIFAKFSSSTNTTFQSTEAIQESLKKLMPKSDLDFAGNDELVAAIPPHFIIKGVSNLFGDTLFETFNKINDEINKNPVVESASYGKTWADKYNSILRSCRGAAILFIGALAIALILVIGNSIRSHINSRREEIEILELVGATSGLIRKPFLIEGTLISTLAMGLALAIINGGLYLLKNTSIELIQVLDVNSILWQPSVIDLLGALILSAGIGFFGSYLCLTEINTGWAASGQGRSFTQLLNFFQGLGRAKNG